MAILYSPAEAEVVATLTHDEKLRLRTLVSRYSKDLDDEFETLLEMGMM